MSKELRAILAKLASKQGEVRSLMDENKIEDAEKAMEEVRALQKQVQIQKELDEQEERSFKGSPANAHGKEEVRYTGELFYRALVGEELADEERTLVKKIQTRALSETGDPKEGGNVVPDDISTEITEAIKDEESVRTLVRVETVKSKTGKRIVRTGKPNRLINTAEKGAIKAINNPNYDVVQYNQNKYAGMMDVPSELLDDSFVSFKDELVDWLSDASRETENYEVFYGAGGDFPEGIISSKEKYKEIVSPSALDIKFLRSVKNSIKKGYRKSAVWVMNTQAFEAISNIEDKNGRSILAEDPRMDDNYTLFGRPVEVYDTIETDETTGKTVILFGDFQRAYRMFARKNFEVKMTDIGAGAFETDETKARGIERFDGRIMDTAALVIVRGVVVAEAAPTTLAGPETPPEEA